MNLKYKEGDKVLIKPFDYLNGHYLTDEYDVMATDWGGKVMTIAECHYRANDTYYYMFEDDGEWCWFEALIECLAGPDININTNDLLDFIGT